MSSCACAFDDDGGNRASISDGNGQIYKQRPLLYELIKAEEVSMFLLSVTFRRSF